MKKAIKFFAALCIAGSLLGCKSKPSTSTSSESSQQTEKALNIMFVVTGNLGGGTNNDDVNLALSDYTKKYGGNLDTYECNMDTSVYESTLMQAAQTGNYDLIVTGFGTMAEPLANTAKAYPDQKFMIFDTAIDYSNGQNSNIISVQVKQNQGAFLAGALAALVTQSNIDNINSEKVIGFVGAMESTAIQDCLIGYIEGAKYVDSSVNVIYSFVGNHKDSALTKEIALTQNQNGADVIYGVSQSDLAVADAALENNFYAICSDADDAKTISATSEDTAKHILTSVIKNYYSMVYPIVEEIGAGTAQFGTHKAISYAEGGVYLADNQYYQAIVNDDIKEKFEKIIEDVKNDKVKIDTAYGASVEEIKSIISKASDN